ncbi:MAG: riboflavin biosynthesis protein RibF [Betaproteobacteria bacterium AqS2]|uniref:Riboflavin biosynthesis protein n=1 Tax=Candidatus Amphirhobacter heronislandensis TaxID=1732024 RepID=A0A930UH52_9GAMM|nr:riboflavin biosynthesis protein RibF [Betaproteobacteria bacterium AqS2]
MRIRANWAPPPRPAALAIGNFDGVHRGHQGILGRLLEAAAAADLCPAALSFEPHPLALLAPARTPARLIDLRTKAALLAAAGIEQLNVMAFTRAFASLPAEEFVRLLRERLGMRALVAGEDFRFGQGRRGDADMLRTLAPELGFELLVVKDVAAGPDRVASKLVRAALQANELDRAAELLGRRYCFGGRVGHGDRLGRELGFATANVFFNGSPPLRGIYAATARLGDRSWAAALSVGVRPTVPGGRLAVEAHLLDYAGPDFYGELLQVEPRFFLRPEEKYAGLPELQEAIAADVARCRELLSAAAP